MYQQMLFIQTINSNRGEQKDSKRYSILEHCVNRYNYSMVTEIIFLIGLGIFLAYIFFFLFSKREEEKKKSDSYRTDDVDYDGHGNYGRFPTKEN
jgi:hypothetical protein